MLETILVGLVVGVVETGPGVCQVETLNPDETISTSYVGCEWIAPDYESFASPPN